MPSRYAGRHRTQPAAGRGRHRAAGRPRRAGAIKPLAISALSLGVTFAIVQTAVSSPFGDITRASALDHSAGRAALAVVASTESATPVSATVTPSASATTSTAAPTASASGVATATTTATPTPTPTPTIDQGKVWMLPVASATFTSDYGPRWGAFHHGIDLANVIGTPLRAMSSGIVIFAGQQSGYGNIVEIRYWDGTVSYYGHMNSIAVSVGQPVLPGQVVGQLGNTGESTGPHLHLEIHPGGGADVDPEPWLLAHGMHAR